MIINNTPNVICRGADTLTHTLTHIYLIFRDKLSLLGTDTLTHTLTHNYSIFRDKLSLLRSLI